MPTAKRRDPNARLGMPPKSQNRSGGDMRRFVKSKDVEKKPQAWAVGLDKWTLSFSNSALDGEWRRLVAGRSRALWLRSLLSATLYQALRHAADTAQFGPAPQWVVAVRLVLAVTEVLLFAVAYCDLLRPSQAAIAANAFLYGIVELALVVDRLRPRVAPGDWLHVRDAASSKLTPSTRHGLRRVDGVGLTLSTRDGVGAGARDARDSRTNHTGHLWAGLVHRAQDVRLAVLSRVFRVLCDCRVVVFTKSGDDGGTSRRREIWCGRRPLALTQKVGALCDASTYPRVHGRRLRPKDTRCIGRVVGCQTNFLAGRFCRLSVSSTGSGTVQRRRLLVREIC